MVEIIKRDCDWRLAKNECRTTMGKAFTEKEPDSAFIEKLVISEHSPLRLIRYLFRFTSIPSYVATHFARHHEGVEKWVQTQRTDRTGIDRHTLPQDEPVTEDIEANAQALINMSKVRLCYQASSETRKRMEALKAEIGKEQPELSRAMVPSCIYRCGCPEFHSCGYFKAFVQWAGANGYDILTISERYKAYDDWIRRPQRLGEGQ